MCDHGPKNEGGWEGWIELPAALANQGHGAWRDLSHPLGDSMPRVPIVPPPRFELFKRMPEDPFNVTEMQMVVHQGTHLDAPRHFLNDGPAMHEIPLDRLYGPGVVWRFDCEPYQVLEPADFEAKTPKLSPGDILILDTGWSEHVGTETYEAHPCLSTEAAKWLVEAGIKLLAVDFGTPEAAPGKRWKGWKWPVHHVLLSRGILISEHIRAPRPLADQRIEAMFLALNIENADGAPARVVARPLD